MPALEKYCEERLSALEEQSLRRDLVQVEREDGIHITVDGKRYISFSCNDYFGLSKHPEVMKAASEAVQKHGTGAGASRLVTGNSPAYAELEALLAKTKQKEAALVFGSGYLANIGVIGALAEKGDLILADKLSHACMLDGATLSGAKLLRFKHNDLGHLEQLLERHRKDYRNCILLTETIFSMDGDAAPMDALRDLANRYDAWLVADDAHGLGLPNIKSDLADVIIGTLSKAAGGYGGYVAASQSAIDTIINFGRSFIFSTGLPYGYIASNIKAIGIINHKSINERLVKNIEYFSGAMGLKSHPSAIFPIVIGEAEAALKAQAELKEKGLWVGAIRPPTVPPGTARLRVTLSVLHEKEHLDQLIEALQPYV